MAKLKEMEAVMNEYFEARSEAAGSGLVVLPGVVELLRALQVVGVIPLLSPDASYTCHFSALLQEWQQGTDSGLIDPLCGAGS